MRQSLYPGLSEGVTPPHGGGTGAQGVQDPGEETKGSQKYKSKDNSQVFKKISRTAPFD